MWNWFDYINKLALLSVIQVAYWAIINWLITSPGSTSPGSLSVKPPHQTQRSNPVRWSQQQQVCRFLQCSLIDAPHMCIKEPALVVPHSQSANAIVISRNQVSSLNSTTVSCAATVGVWAEVVKSWHGHSKRPPGLCSANLPGHRAPTCQSFQFVKPNVSTFNIESFDKGV